MGPKFTKPTRGDHKVGKSTECPMCGESLPAKTTYDAVNAHIDKCMTDPAGASEKRRIRELESKYKIFSLS